MKRNPLKKALVLGAIVLGTLLVAPTQDADAHWRRRGYWGPASGYSTWYVPTYGGYYYAAPRYYYTAPRYYYTPSYSYYPSYGYYGTYYGYPGYGYYGSSYYSPGFGYYRSGYRGGWGFSIGF